MNNENTNCCETENSDCNTQENNDCCTTDTKVKNGSNKKKIGLGILLLAITFAVVSAFNSSNSSKTSDCGDDKDGCTTSCEIGDEESSCCSE